MEEYASSLCLFGAWDDFSQMGMKREHINYGVEKR
jgi:hypothetical protein